MDIKIARTSPTCKKCDRAFTDGETMTTALRLTDEEVYSRIDICRDCWPAQDAEEFLCFWSAEYSTKRRSPLLDAEVLWQVFLGSLPGSASSTTAAEFAYVSGLGLMRLKQLVLEETRREENGELLLFRTRGKKSQRKHYEVLDLRLDEQGIERVQERLADFDPSAPMKLDDEDSEPA